MRRAGDCNSYFTAQLEGVGEINPVETLNIAPAQFNKDIINEVYALLEKCALAFDINWGPVGGDFVLTEEGLKVIEISPRLHGPNGTVWIYQLATGINPLKYLAQTVCGDKPDMDLLMPNMDSIGICKVFVGKPGKPRIIHIPTNDYIVHQNIYVDIGKEYNTHGNYYSGTAAVFLQTPDLETGKKQLRALEKNFIYDIE